VELLWIYGADVGQKNMAGQTAADIAKSESHVGDFWQYTNGYKNIP
jgi:hypothetical protein